MKTLLFFDTLRGKDSTGLAAIRMNGSAQIVKKTVPGHDFIDDPALDKAMSFTDKVWIGHNRFGTIGHPTKANAHPFFVGDDDKTFNLIGAHNGTLKNRHVLTDYDKYGTDSEALFNEIDKTGIDKAIKLVDGAWALTWFCNYTDTMNFLRNKERSLFYVFTKDMKSMFWASEAWMLSVSLSREGMEMHEDGIKAFDVDKLYVFYADLKMNEELTFEVKEGYTGREVIPFQNYQPRKDWWSQEATQERQKNQREAAEALEKRVNQRREEQSQRQLSLPPASGTQSTGIGGHHTNGNSTSSQEPKASDTNGGNSTNVATFRPHKGFNGVKLTRIELENALAGGCAFCETEVIDMDDRFAWIGHNLPVCSHCLDGDYADDEYSKMYVTMELIKNKSVH